MKIIIGVWYYKRSLLANIILEKRGYSKSRNEEILYTVVSQIKGNLFSPYSSVLCVVYKTVESPGGLVALYARGPGFDSRRFIGGRAYRVVRQSCVATRTAIATPG